MQKFCMSFFLKIRKTKRENKEFDILHKILYNQIIVTIYF